MFKTTFISVAENHAPIIQKRIRGIDNCPWLDSSIKNAIKQRDHLHKKACKTTNIEDWANYRSLRNRVNNMVKRAKGAYNRRLLEENKNDSKMLWKTVKKIIPTESKELSSGVRIGGIDSSDKVSIATAFNKHFIGAVKRLRDAVGASIVSVARTIKTNVAMSSQVRQFHFKEVSVNFTLRQLRDLKTGKAAGLDNIPPRLLKDAADIVATPLTIIINASLRQGRVPDDWKSARVIPLFKKGKTENLDNYRPISILPTASKLLERIVHKQVGDYLREHNILSPYQ